MDLVNATSFPFAVLPGKVRPPEWSATVIVKGSFALKNGGPAQPLPEPLPFMGDVHRDEDIANDCFYDSDFAPWKQNVDALLVGTCHAPGGKPTTACRVEFAVGRWSKALAVIGNRQWKAARDSTRTRPAAATRRRTFPTSSRSRGASPARATGPIPPASAP
jgi:hypothetical protein